MVVVAIKKQDFKTWLTFATFFHIYGPTNHFHLWFHEKKVVFFVDEKKKSWKRNGFALFTFKTNLISREEQRNSLYLQENDLFDDWVIFKVTLESIFGFIAWYVQISMCDIFLV